MRMHSGRTSRSPWKRLSSSDARRAPLLLALSLLTALPGAGVSRAAVERVEVIERGAVADGREFGLAGSYERLRGRVYFAVDPSGTANSGVVDLDKAPRDADGLVRFSADFHVVRPVDASKGNGSVLLEVPDGGRKLMLNTLNLSPAIAPDPVAGEEIGDGLLMRRGFTLAWVGWQFDLPDDPGLMRLEPVYATAVPRPIEGYVRVDQVFDEPDFDMHLGARSAVAYPVTEPGHPRNTLTVRGARLGARRVIPRAQWTFGRWDGERSLPDRSSIVLFGGFEPGLIYESVYLARDPAIAGLGLAAVRDFGSFLKHSGQSPAPCDHVIGFGVSQAGRFLRHFLFEGFNADESGARVFDGVIAHGAGAGRGSFNHRFAQPSREAEPFSSFFYPIDVFPFSSREQVDPETQRSDGLLSGLEGTDAMPKVFLTNSSYEYWGRGAALIHTRVDGLRDVPPLDNERVYFFSGTQHLDEPLLGKPAAVELPANPASYRRSLRALTLAMNEWVSSGVEPPASRIPRIADRSLVRPLSLAFPLLPDVAIPRTPHEAYRVEYGPRFESEGVIDWQPPAVGSPYPVLVPQVDADGNEIAGIRLPELQVPLATYTGWNWRSAEIGAPQELVNRRGSFLPLPLTPGAREASGDPRRSVAERYPGKDAYLGRYAKAAVELVEQRFLLVEDLPALISHAERLWDELHADADAGAAVSAPPAR